MSRRYSVEKSTKRYLVGFLWLGIGLAFLPIVSLVYSALPDQSLGFSFNPSSSQITRITFYSAWTGVNPSWFPMDQNAIRVEFTTNRITTYYNDQFVGEFYISDSRLILFVSSAFYHYDTGISIGDQSFTIRSANMGGFNFGCNSYNGFCHSFYWSVPSNFTLDPSVVIVSFVGDSYNTTRAFGGGTFNVGASSKGIMGLILFAIPVVFFIQGVRRLLWIEL